MPAAWKPGRTISAYACIGCIARRLRAMRAPPSLSASSSARIPRATRCGAKFTRNGSGGKRDSPRRPLERRDGVEELLAEARLLVVGERAAAAVRDARLGQLVERHRVGRADVLRPQYARDLKL